MRHYVDYKFYTDSYLGKLSEEEFKSRLLEAQSTVDYYTFDRLKSVPEEDFPIEGKLAVCSLIDFLDSYYKEGGIIKSESTGSHSVTYETGTQNSKIEREKEIVTRWLEMTGYMYRGVYYDF